LQYADKLFFLKEGELVAQGNPSEIITEHLIEEVFNVKTSIINNPVSNRPLVIFGNKK